MKRTKLMLGDNIESLRKLPDNSIDSVVTDPPYGLSFMGKKWDYDVPSVEFWKEVYRVLKPGSHILSFGGTRTYHRMVVNIEDAGFEIRDQIMWLYGSGFPKSHNIGKAVDKIKGNDREVKEYIAPDGKKRTGVLTGSEYYKDDDDTYNNDTRYKTKGSSPYEGWGTALKPANEPICVARKPLSEKSVAENVLKWGTGGINIDGCRVGTDTIRSVYGGFTNALVDGRDENTRKEWIENSKKENGQFNTNENEGRFPANLILDEEAAQILDEQSGISKSTSSTWNGFSGNGSLDDWKRKSHTKKIEGGYDDKGGASRFFYIPKVSKKERNMGLDGFEDRKDKTPNSYKDGVRVNNRGEIREATISKNNHPTVKPVQLMAYLCRLITPTNGIVLDPYMGSGSTGISALLEGFRFCGMEMDEDYFKIAQARIENYESYREFLKK